MVDALLGYFPYVLLEYIDKISQVYTTINVSLIVEERLLVIVSDTTLAVLLVESL